jgi:acyl carrier protein
MRIARDRAGSIPALPIMTRQEILTRVMCLVSDHFGITERSLVENTDVVKDLQADSLDCVEIILDLEDEFKIFIADEDMMRLTKIGELTDHIFAALSN